MMEPTVHIKNEGMELTVNRSGNYNQITIKESGAEEGSSMVFSCDDMTHMAKMILEMNEGF